MDNCIFRAMGPEEAPRMIELVRERIAWMDREGLQSWNTSDYLEIYPQDYYEERAREGVLFALARASDGKILCAGALLETDESWPDGLPAVYVHHLVSAVEGELQKGKDVMDLIGAAFPGGSVTGAPKLRAMEIIDDLERGRRNLYTGSMGYVTLDGDCDFNIVIRTAIYQNGVYHLGVGGGITCESEREFEHEETLQKAKAVLEAIRG